MMLHDPAHVPGVFPRPGETFRRMQYVRGFKDESGEAILTGKAIMQQVGQ